MAPASKAKAAAISSGRLKVDLVDLSFVVMR
jgi:hypothetical protein